MLIFETLLIWLAAIIFAIIVAPVVFILSILLVLFAFFVLVIMLASIIVIGTTTLQVLAWPFRRLYALFS